MGQQAGQRRTTPDVDAVDDAACTVLHIDMDAFFAAVELRRDPSLRGRPMMVAGVGGRGVVLSASYEARAYGVRSAMPTAQAMARCPGIVVVPPDHHAYRAASVALMDLLGRVTPIVEPVSVDEAFLDVTGATRRLGRPGRIAANLRIRVREELELPATVGVASTKFVAKLASSLAKPDGLLIIPPAQVESTMRPLPVHALWGVGPKTADRLRSCGFGTVGDVADASPAALARIVGASSARSLLALAHGRDQRRVTPESTEASIGAEQTFADSLVGDGDIARALIELSATAARRARRGGFAGRTVVLKARFDDFTTVTRSETVPVAVDTDRQVYDAVRRGWRRLAAAGRPVRLLGVRLENLVRPETVEEQLALNADPDRPGPRAAQRALDAIADRFGSAAPRPASLVSSPARPSAGDGRAGKQHEDLVSWEANHGSAERSSARANRSSTGGGHGALRT